MKRRELEKRLRIGARTGVVEAFPRHTEIKEPLARKILKSLNVDL
jgi:hypothetical protein